MSLPPARARSACWRSATGDLLVVVSSTAIGNIRERVAGIDAAIVDVAGAQAELIEAGNEVAEIAAAVVRPAGAGAAADRHLHPEQRADARDA